MALAVVTPCTCECWSWNISTVTVALVLLKPSSLFSSITLTSPGSLLSPCPLSTPDVPAPDSAPTAVPVPLSGCSASDPVSSMLLLGLRAMWGARDVLLGTVGTVVESSG